MPQQNPNTGVGRLNADLRDAAANLAGPAAQLAAGASAGSVVKSTITDAAISKLLGPTALFASGMLAILGTIRRIVEETGLLDHGLSRIARNEQISGQFETLLKSAVLAKKRLQELYSFTANSPFKFDDVAEANRSLQALTGGALAGEKGMTLVGDSAAATGQQISDVADRVGRLYNALNSGRSLDRILFQMQSTGLVTDTLAKKLEELEDRGAGFAEKWGVVEDALSATSGGMKNEAKNLDALAARLENASDRAAAAFAEPFRDAKAKSLKISIDATENVTPVLKEIGEDLAPILTLNSVFKNSIAESTLATKGFADALRVAWQIGKVAFAGIGLATLGQLTTRLAGATRFTANVLTGATRAVRAEKQPGGKLAQASELFGAAAGALAPGGEGVAVATSLAVEAVALKTATLAGVVHAQAMKAVGEATGLAAVSNYAAAASVAVFGGALNLAKRAAIGLAAGVRASVAALLSNPLTASLLAVGAAASGFLIWRKAIKDVDAAYAELAEQIATTNKKLTEQANAASTTEEWTASVNGLTTAYGKALDALEAFKDEQKGKSPITEAVKDFVIPNRAEKREASRKELEGAVSKISALRQDQLDRINNVGLSDREKEQYKNELQQREAAREQEFQQKFGTSDAETQNKLVEERIALLRKEAATGREAESARNAFDRSPYGKLAFKNDAKLRDLREDEERTKRRGRALGLTDADFENPTTEAAQRRALETTVRNEPITPGLAADAQRARNAESANRYRDQAKVLSDLGKTQSERGGLESVIAALRRGNTVDELTRNLQEQSDIRTDLAKNPAQPGERDERSVRLVALQKRAIEINEAVGNFRQKEQAAQQLGAELTEAKKVQALKELEIQLDRQIADARQHGLETASLEMEKQIKLLERQRNLATTKPQEKRAIEAQIANVRGFQAEFRAETAVNRERNRRNAKGDFVGAQAITDAMELRRLTDTYAANGLTPAQAKEDFALNLEAQRRLNAPAIVADSLQAVGGGGGISQVQDSIQERMARTAEAQLVTLKRIEDAVKAGGGGVGIE